MRPDGLACFKIKKEGGSFKAAEVWNNKDLKINVSTPVLVDLKPTGPHYMEDLFAAGGIGAVLRELKPLLHLECVTVAGETLRQAPRSSMLSSLAGRAAAWLEIGAVSAYEQRLAAASDRLHELAELRASVRKQPKRTRPKTDSVVSQRRAA